MTIQRVASDLSKDFLRSIQVRANLVVPVLLPPRKLWGLLISHNCHKIHSWSSSDITVMKNAAEVLATSPTILGINSDQSVIEPQN